MDIKIRNTFIERNMKFIKVINTKLQKLMKCSCLNKHSTLFILFFNIKMLTIVIILVFMGIYFTLI